MSDTAAAAPAPPANEAKPAKKRLEKVSPPDEQPLLAAQGEKDELQAKLDALQAQMNTERASINVLKGQVSEEVRKGAPARSALGKVREQRKMLLDKRDIANAEIAELREKSKRMRSNMKFERLSDVDRAIRRLEQRQSTESLSLKEEKDLIKEIKELNQIRKTVAVYDSHVNATNAKAKGGQAKDLGQAIRDVSAKLKSMEAAYKKDSTQVNKLKAALRERQRDKLPGLTKEANELRKQIRGKYNEIRTLKDAFFAQKKAYYNYTKEVNKEKWERRKKEDEEYRKEQEQRRKEYEEELAKQKPWLEEIAVCDCLIEYLTKYLPKAEKVVEKKQEKDLSMDGMVMMSKKTGDDVILFGPAKGRGKKKKGKKRNKNKQRRYELVHGIDTLGMFGMLKLSPPGDVDQVPASIELVQAKRDYYDTLPRDALKKVKKTKTSKKAGAGKQNGGGGKKVQTPFGSGVVAAKREDGGLNVTLDWTLSEGQLVHAYLPTFSG